MGYITATEASHYLKVSEQHVRSLIRKKLLISERVGNQWIINRDDLKSFIVNNNIHIEPEDHPRVSSEIPKIVALSFFSGAMGLDIGMEKAGISPLLVCEIDKETRKTINANKPDVALIGDIRDYSAKQILEFAKIPESQTIDVIFGGPPCQAFSTAGKQRGFEDDRGNVFLTFVDRIIELKPKYFAIENVRGLLSAPYTITPAIEPQKGGALLYITKRLENAGYTLSFDLYNTANFGAAQIRERLVIIGKRGAEAVSLLSPTNSENGEFGLPKWRTLRDAIGSLDVEHHYVSFPEKRLRYYRFLKEGQNWRNLPDNLQEQAMGKSYYLSGGKTGFYRRLSFKRPSPTLVTHPAMPATDLCHPTEDRPLSIEEYREIQGFPKQWIFCGSVLDVYRQIGNAVPIPMGIAIGKAIIADMANKEQPQYDGFQYSRYQNTNYKNFQRNI